jgi:hypothetical protein
MKLLKNSPETGEFFLGNWSKTDRSLRYEVVGGSEHHGQVRVHVRNVNHVPDEFSGVGFHEFRLSRLFRIGRIGLAPKHGMALFSGQLIRRKVPFPVVLLVG